MRGALISFILVQLSLASVFAEGDLEVVTNFTECGRQMVDLTFVLDASGSIGESDFDKVRQFLQSFIERDYDPKFFRIAVVAFSTTSHVEFDLDDYTDKDAIMKAMGAIKYTGGATNTAGALNRCRKEIFSADHGDRPEAPNLVILATDGVSNINRELTIPEAKALKHMLDVPIYGIGIGQNLSSDHSELDQIVSEPKEDWLQLVPSYKELEEKVMKTICKVIQKVSVVKAGEVCHKEGQIVTIGCRKFTCSESIWNQVYLGCPLNGCMKWGEVQAVDCDKFKCSPVGTLNKNNEAADYKISLESVGCLEEGGCKNENEVWKRPKTCQDCQCKRTTNADGEPEGVIDIIAQGCMDPNGKCREQGYTYDVSCVQYQCGETMDSGVKKVQFFTAKPGCEYKGKCIPFGETVEDSCNIKECVYDDLNSRYHLVITEFRCVIDQACKKVREKWDNKTSCTSYECMLDDFSGNTYVKSEIIGCRGNDECTPPGEVVMKKNCFEYKCSTSGNFQLIKKRCSDMGKCYEVGQTFRRENVCAQFTCLDDPKNPNDVIIDKKEECRDPDGKCMLPGDKYTRNCAQYECKKKGGTPERISAECEYQSKCYAIKATWIDKKICRKFRCDADETMGAKAYDFEYGCVAPDKVCYGPGEDYKDPDTCMVLTCADDHAFRRKLCQYKDTCYAVGQSWIDNEECINVTCKENKVTGHAYTDSAPYGCMDNKKCYAPGDRIKRGCDTYECKGGGFGFSIVIPRCNYNDECKEVGQEWFDNEKCTKLQCQAVGKRAQIVEVKYGCVSTNDNCIRPNNEHAQDDCIKFFCDNGTLVPTEKGCRHRDTCVPIGKSVQEEDDCAVYTCVEKDSGPGFIATELVPKYGCVDHGKCYWTGETKVENCITYKCLANSSFVVEDAQCFWEGKCIEVGTEWEHTTNCLNYSCVIDVVTSMPKVDSDLWGCKDRQGKCHPFGTKLEVNPCVFEKCEKRPGMGPEFFPVDVGCEVDGKCRKLDSSWVDTTLCKKRTCKSVDGAQWPKVFDNPYGCINKGKCHKFDDVITEDDNRCVKYACTSLEIFNAVEVGCPWKETECKANNERWNDTDTCTMYGCYRENVGASKVVMRTEATKGCKDTDGSCLWTGEVIQKGCTWYQCDPAMEGLSIIEQRCTSDDGCKKINETWFDKDTCTDFICNWNAQSEELSIDVVTQGCKDEGRCFVQGEKKKEGCNKFQCTAGSEFKPIKMGCEWKGQCYNIGANWTENCVMYTCVLVEKGPDFVKTRVDEVKGCISGDGKCFMPGQIKKEDCIDYVCLSGGQFRMKKFACKGFNGDCVPGGTITTKDCMNYFCDEYTQALIPSFYRCQYNGKCKEIDEQWFDEDKCKGYKCVFDLTLREVKIVERTEGCVSGSGKCYRGGAIVQQENDCVKYECKSGQLVPLIIGCEWKDKCMDLGHCWQDGCTWYKCEQTSSGDEFVETNVKATPGCTDCHQKCYAPGEYVTEGCTTRQCMAGGVLQPITMGCMGPDGQCYQPGSYMAPGPSSLCIPDNYNTSALQLKQCRDEKMKTYKVGDRRKVGCDVYECQEDELGSSFKLIEQGCEYNGECMQQDETWEEKQSGVCKWCQCSKQKNSLGGTQTKVNCDIGCQRDGVCYRNQETWDEGCFTMKCETQKRDDFSYSMKMYSIDGGCAQNLTTGIKCHKAGDIWTVTHKNICLQLQCVCNKDGDVSEYITKTYKPMCIDRYNKCRNVGETGFEVMYNGDVHKDCVCKLEGDKVSYACASK